MFLKTIFSRIILLYFFLLGIQAENTIKIIDYQEKLDPQTFPYDIPQKNAEKFVQIIETTNENVIIFPEYALTSKNPISLVKSHLDQYQLILKNGENLCNNTQMALKLIGCAAKEKNKDILLTVVEKAGDNFYSTVIHIDKTGILKNTHRKEIIIDEKRIVTSEKNPRIFNINGEDYVILMGYEAIDEKLDSKYKNIIYFPPLSASSPLLFNPMPLGVKIYSAPPIDYNKMSENYTLNFPVKNLDEGSQDCKIEWSAEDKDTVKNNYKMLTFNGNIPESDEEVKICSFASTTGITTNFESVKLSIDRSQFVVSGASLKDDHLEPIEPIEKSENGATVKNVKNLLAYTIITTGSGVTANISFFLLAMSLTLRWLL